MKIIDKSEKLNAFIYEGSKSRLEKTKSLTAGNMQVQIGDIFSVSALDSGLLLIFYNSDDSEGSFSFEYWITASTQSDNNSAQ